MGGHQRFYAHLIRLDVVARFSCQDHQLTHDVFPGKIDARVRFRQPLLPGLIDQISKRYGAVKLQEQPRESAGENTAQRQNGIAAINQIAHRMVDWQTGADGSVVQPVAPGFLERIVDLAIFTAATGASQLIRADNVEAMAGKIEVLIGQLLAGGYIQHH